MGIKYGKKKKKNKKNLLEINFLDKFSKKTDVIALDINIKGTLVASGQFNGKISIFTETAEIMENFCIPEGAVFEIKWSENSRIIVITNGLGSIFIWSCWKFQFLVKISIYKFSLLSLKWINKHEFLSFSKENFIGFLNICKRFLKIYKIHSFKINEMAISEEINIASICSDDKKISIWNLKNNFCFSNFLFGHEKEITFVSFKPFSHKKFPKKKGHLLYSCSIDFCFKIWKIYKKGYISFTILKIGPYLSISWNGLGNRLILSLPKGELLTLKNHKIISKNYFVKKTSIFAIVSHPMIERKAGLFSKNIFCI
jgi:WD40 repeat protein